MASSSNILISIMETCISMGNESIKRKWPENNFHRNINDDLCSLGSKHIAYLFLFLVFFADFELSNFKICADENFNMKLGKFSFSDIYMFSRF